MTQALNLSFRLCMLILAAVFALTAGFIDYHGYRDNNFPCRANFQCQSGFCNASLLCEAQKNTTAPCLVDEACVTGRCSGGVCQVKQSINGTCNVNSDCNQGWCSNATCSPLKGKEALCQNDFECMSGRCTHTPRVCTFALQERHTCGKDADCYNNRCKKDRGINRCIARKYNGDACVDDGDCLSLRCDQGNCTEPVWLGEPCIYADDCYSVLCNKAQNKCVATIAAADTSVSYDPEYHIAGSAMAAAAYADNGTVDLQTGQIFSAVSTPPGNTATSAALFLSYFSTVLLALGSLAFYYLA